MRERAAAPGIEGRLVRLRAVEPEDWELLRRIAEETRREGGPADLPTSAQLARAVATDLAAARADDDRTFVVETASGVAAGVASVEHSDRRHGVFRYGIGILADYRRRGYGSDAVRTLLRFYFDQLGYGRAEAEVLEENEASVRLHESLRFRLEGRRRAAVLVDGVRHDLLLYGILADEHEHEHEPGEESPGRRQRSGAG
jgi:RimJ/RimL family protein N-acetyltransferase